MKGVILPGNKKIELRDFPDPEPGPGDAVIRVKTSAICRSDLSLYHGESIVAEVGFALSLPGMNRLA